MSLPSDTNWDCSIPDHERCHRKKLKAELNKFKTSSSGFLRARAVITSDDRGASR